MKSYKNEKYKNSSTGEKSEYTTFYINPRLGM